VVAVPFIVVVMLASIIAAFVLFNVVGRRRLVPGKALKNRYRAGGQRL